MSEEEKKLIGIKVKLGVQELINENEKMHSIIEEVREYIDKWKFEVAGNGACMEYEDIQDILEILDKEKDNE